MAEMTKKALNKIKAAAFTEFKQGFSEEEFRNLFAGGKNVVTQNLQIKTACGQIASCAERVTSTKHTENVRFCR